MEVKFVSKIRKRRSSDSTEVYYVTIPKVIVESYNLEKFVGQKVKITLTIENGTDI